MNAMISISMMRKNQSSKGFYADRIQNLKIPGLDFEYWFWHLCTSLLMYSLFLNTRFLLLFKRPKFLDEFSMSISFKYNCNRWMQILWTWMKSSSYETNVCRLKYEHLLNKLSTCLSEFKISKWQFFWTHFKFLNKIWHLQWIWMPSSLNDCIVTLIPVN